MENEGKRTGRFDYKWVVIGLCFLMVFVALGFCSSPKSFFIGPVSSALGVDRSVYSINDSFRYVSTAVINIFFGFLVAKLGPKVLILSGFTSLVTSMLLYAFASNLVMLYLGGMFLGIGLSWTTTTMVGYVVSRWCKENKGTIMGAVLASNGVGGALAIKILSPIIDSSPMGYRKAYIVVACVLASVAVLILCLFRNSPKGVAVDKTVVKHKKKKKRGKDWIGISFGDATKKLYFWGVLVCIFLTGFTLQGVNGVTAQYYKDVGLDTSAVTNILSLHSLVLALAKFFTGFSYDKFGLRITSGICLVSALASSTCLVLINPSPTGIALAVVNSIISCFALPLETIMLPIYAADLFGERSFDKVLGIFVSVNTAGYALGAPVINACYDVTGSYKIGFAISLGVLAFIAILLQFVLSAASRTQRRVIAEHEAKLAEQAKAVEMASAEA